VQLIEIAVEPIATGQNVSHHVADDRAVIGSTTRPAKYREYVTVVKGYLAKPVVFEYETTWFGETSILWREN
jgi:hypothetical protein